MIRALSQDQLSAFRDGAEVSITVGDQTETLQPDDLDVLEEASGDDVVKSEAGHVVALDPALDDELLREGMARELVNRIQRLRKDAGLEITDRIALGAYGPGEVTEAADAWADFIRGETLAVELEVAETGDAADWTEFREVDLDGTTAHIGLRRVEV